MQGQFLFDSKNSDLQVKPTLPKIVFNTKRTDIPIQIEHCSMFQGFLDLDVLPLGIRLEEQFDVIKFHETLVPRDDVRPNLVPAFYRRKEAKTMQNTTFLVWSSDK